MLNNGAKKVLIIEDEPIICTMCQRIFNEKGFEIDVVNDGRAAEEAVSEKEYDLLLLDLRLPVESGDEFYIWLAQELPEFKERVIFMTGSVMGGDTMNLLQKSGRPYLLKPFRPDDLKNIVDEFMKESE